MQGSEIYRYVPHKFIPGTHSVEPSFSVSSPVPFKEGHLECFSFVGVENGGTRKTDQGIALIKISPNHGRSYEINFGQTRGVFWEDEFGNLFYGITIKGNNLTNPYVRRSMTGYEVWGLCDSNSIARTVRVSEILRSESIDTEFILRVVEPKRLPYLGKDIKMPTLKKKLIQKAVDERGLLEDDVSDYLNNTTFLIITRAMQVSERIGDLAEAPDRSVLLEILKRVFVFVNFSEELKVKRDPSYEPHHFEVEREGDLLRYFSEYLPIRIGTNYGRLHKIRLKHDYANPGNISAVGSIYDLDSVWGELLGDDPATDDDFNNEFAAVGFTVTGALDKIIGTLVLDQYDPALFQQNLSKYYQAERFRPV